MELLNLQTPLWLTIMIALIAYITGAVIEHNNMKGKYQSEETRRNNSILKTHYKGRTWLSNKSSYTGTEKK